MKTPPRVKATDSHLKSMMSYVVECPYCDHTHRHSVTKSKKEFEEYGLGLRTSHCYKGQYIVEK